MAQRASYILTIDEIPAICIVHMYVLNFVALINSTDQMSLNLSVKRFTHETDPHSST